MSICVNALSVVNAYYRGQLRVRADSLQIPSQSYFSVKTETSQIQQKKNTKKRKRDDDRLAELIACGKFIPVDERLLAALKAAHSDVLRNFSLSQFLPINLHVSVEAEAKLQVEEHLHLITGGSLHENSTGLIQFARVDSSSTRIVLPPYSTFVLGDVRKLSHVTLDRYNLIVMDPPWKNNSVGRGKRYVTFHHEELLKIDIPAIVQEDHCVLAIWVTNKPQYTTFILQNLLPKWGFSYHDTWYWLKICKNGELVTPLESTHRLPFEKLIVAYRGSSSNYIESLQLDLGSTRKIVASIPLRHSWKPPPECFFGAFASKNEIKKVEFFARELRPHWTSIGNEERKQT